MKTKMMKLIAIDENGQQFDMPPIDKIGAWISRNRIKAGLSLNDVGSVLGVTRQAVYCWETQRANPSIVHMMKLVVLFNTTSEPAAAAVSA